MLENVSTIADLLYDYPSRARNVDCDIVCASLNKLPGSTIFFFTFQDFAGSFIELFVQWMVDLCKYGSIIICDILNGCSFP
jgi:hypothetical protein